MLNVVLMAVLGVLVAVYVVCIGSAVILIYRGLV